MDGEGGGLRDVATLAGSGRHHPRLLLRHGERVRSIDGMAAQFVVGTWRRWQGLETGTFVNVDGEFRVVLGRVRHA